jgi:Preprotein translocase subunit SecD
MNRYPLWKNLLILGVILFGLLLAWPNLYSQDPAIEITAARGHEITQASVAEIKAALENAKVPLKGIESLEGGKLLARFGTPGEQLQGQEAIERTLSERYRTALTQSANLPGWMRWLGLNPMSLGLDLRGGIHVVIDVDMEAALDQARERYSGDIRTLLREEKIRYLTLTRDGDNILIRFEDAASRESAEKRLKREFSELDLQPSDDAAPSCCAPAYPRPSNGRSRTSHSTRTSPPYATASMRSVWPNRASPAKVSGVSWSSYRVPRIRAV